MTVDRKYCTGCIHKNKGRCSSQRVLGELQTFKGFPVRLGRAIAVCDGMFREERKHQG